ncbi:MAG TPA: response regulator [Longimicrobiales bacterium]
MSSDDLTSRLRDTFVQELEEHVRQLNRGLLALEQKPGDEELIRSLFRSAHTIKGAARVADEPLVEDACHSMESIFAAVRGAREPLSGSDFALLFATCDALEEAAGRLRSGESLRGSALAALLPRLTALAGAAPPARAPTPPAPAPSAPAPPAPDPAAPPVRAPSRTTPASTPESEAAELVRVRAGRLDELLSAVGELIIATGRIVERAGRGDESARRLDQATDAVAEVVHRLRLRPFGDICESLPRAVRDAAAAEGKEVELRIDGADVEADRVVIDALRDPLLHLVRNAVAHGVESPDARERAGKPRQGLVRVAAELAGGRLHVIVSDDGAGLDEAAIRRKLRERREPEPRTREGLADALLRGGFTTRHEATGISGRGVGLDIVRAALENIGGAVGVEWSEGQGTTFRLECPPTPAVLRAVLVRLGAYLFALPTAHVERLRRVRMADLRSASGGTILPDQDGPIRILSLARLLGPPLEARPLDDTALVAIVRVGTRRAAFVVDEVVAEDEIVMRPLAAEPGAVPHAAGAAILPSGRVAVVLGAPSLLAAGLRTGAGLTPAAPVERERHRLRVLVADDSITTRTLEQSVLEAAGYEVVTAVNGEEAWEALDREGADALVADVEMPRMDGFALCRRVRSSERFRELPIVLVTGRESPEDRTRGLEAGADAYLVKSSFDQADLLGTLDQLIGAA